LVLGASFIGNSFIESSISLWQVRPVPEPETWATAAILLIGGGVYLLRRKKQAA
jgi:LPXTG-motif cell wall-anchored protein